MLAVLLLPLTTLVRPRAKPSRLLLWLSMTLASIGIVTAHGGAGNSKSNSNQTPQTYTITITGTSGNVMHLMHTTMAPSWLGRPRMNASEMPFWLLYFVPYCPSGVTWPES